MFWIFYKAFGYEKDPYTYWNGITWAKDALQFQRLKMKMTVHIITKQYDYGAMLSQKMMKPCDSAKLMPGRVTTNNNPLTDVTAKFPT